MTHSTRFLTILILAFVTNTAVSQANDDERIWRLIRLTDTKANFELVINKLIEKQKTDSTKLLSDEYFELFKGIASDSFEKEGLKAIANFYKQNFSGKEIQEILDFYESRVGKKMIQTLPKLLDYSMEIGESMGERISVDTYDSLQTLMKGRFESKNDNCVYAKTGTFSYETAGLKYQVIRDVDRQKEIADTFTNDLKIEWINNCIYKMTLVSSTDINTNVNEFPVLVINIISDSKEGHEFVGKPANVDFYFQGRLKKLK